tara:strand:+ start:1142 stop:2173 length:1032 start_codon:yes stop_codon:yes gene_type:complete
MIVEIDLFNDLDITKANDFMDHIKYISRELVHSVVNFYLIKICGSDYEKNYFPLKDFLGIISIYHYPEEFLLNSDEKKNINDFMNNIYDLNKNYKTLDISEYVEKNIKPFTQKIRNIFVKIMDNNRQSICQNYSKIYHNFKNLEKDIDDNDSKNHIKTYKEQYYTLLKEILLDNTDSYLDQQEKTQEDNNEYDNFRKTLFMDNLKKDLSKEPPVFNGVVYLIDIIRKKLCFIAPVHSKYNYIKEKINSILDIDYFKQLASNNVFDSSNLLNVFQFIVEKITEFQAESDSNKLKEWVDTIKKEYLDDFSNDKLPSLMDMILKKIEELELNVSKYREHIYNMNDK